MNTIDLQDLEASDRAFAEAARQRLRASESLNYVETARLAAARAQARELMVSPRMAPVWGWLAAPAAIAALAVLVLRWGPVADTGSAVSAMAIPQPAAEVLVGLADGVNDSSPDALMWVSDEAGLDLYADLEFYQWLQSRSRSEPNA